MITTYTQYAGAVNFVGSYEGYLQQKIDGILLFAQVTSGNVPLNWYSPNSDPEFPIYVIYADNLELVLNTYKEFNDIRNQSALLQYEINAILILLNNKLTNVNGETNPLNNSNYVNVSATKVNDTITLSSTVKVLPSPSLIDPTASAATINGLASDGFVNDSIKNALTWKVVNERLVMNPDLI